MLKELRIQNLILVETADILFDPGLNVLSGETGAGKSAIVEALSLVLGERADASVVRSGAEKGVVEAFFDVSAPSFLSSFLEEAGIDSTDENTLVVRREIFANGKSRAFLNNQMAQVNFLRKLGNRLAKFVSQHGNQSLFIKDHHRCLLDQFGDLVTLSLEYGNAYAAESKMRAELGKRVEEASQRFREIEVCQLEIEEIQEAALKPHEEEELFVEYTRLSNADAISHEIEGIFGTLSGEKMSVLSLLARQKMGFERLLSLDARFQEVASSFHSAFLDLQEVSFALQTALTRLEKEPDRLAKVNDRLTLINRLKKKYGATVESIHAYFDLTKKRLAELASMEDRIEEWREQLPLLEQQTERLAAELSQKRKEAAFHMQEAMTQELRSLNMPKAEFLVKMETQRRSSTGVDDVEFYLAPNVGEPAVSLCECASGGEVSRVLLALHVVMGAKEKIPILVFDEVDANIGGKTAAIVGEKLQLLGQSHQVLCITHFPQVARYASRHLQITKQEIGGRTVTAILTLSDQERTAELQRMMGG